MKSKAKLLIDPIYRRKVMFLFGGTPSELREYFSQKHNTIPDFDDCIAGLQWKIYVKKIDSWLFYIWMEDFNIDNLVHETDHLTFDVLRDVGMGFTLEAEEAHAYLQEWYFQEIRAIIQKWKK